MSDSNWHWDNDRQRWVAMNYPTYKWELRRSEWVYANPSMMSAIDASVQNMSTFPDVEHIINKLRQQGDDDV